MNLALVGNTIRRKRIALGLTQQLLADMAGLSRQSLNGIEHGHVNVTLETLGRLLDVLGLTLDIHDVSATVQDRARGLWMAAKGASVSYGNDLQPDELERALATGDVPPQYRPQLAQILDEAPLQLVTRMVAEVAARQRRSPRDIWKQLRALARAIPATRGGLWA